MFESPEPDIARSFEDQKLISEVELALTSDLRAADIFAEVYWHEQTRDYYVFRFEVDEMLGDVEPIKEALKKPDTHSSKLGVSQPYEKGDNLLVWVKRKTPGPIYDENGEQMTG